MKTVNTTITLRPGQMTLADLWHIYQHPVRISPDDSAYVSIQQRFGKHSSINHAGSPASSE
jgi:histidine ammonia-lyase